MQLTKAFKKCRFMIDVANLTITLTKQANLKDELETYTRSTRTVPENKSGRPLMAGKLAKRVYWTYKTLKKIYLIYGKLQPLRNIDALLVVHDLPYYESLQVQLILANLPSIRDFFISRLELRWDFYPGPSTSALQLQKKIAKHLYFKHARRASSRGRWPRKTFYINDAASDAFVKIYIRPKKRKRGARELVRVELTAYRRWLKRVGIEKPEDFRDLDLRKVLRQIVWLDLDERAIRRSSLNLHTQGIWLRKIRDTLNEEGVARVIIDGRNSRRCSTHCLSRAHPWKCRLAAAMKSRCSGWEVLNAIQACPNGKPITNFEHRYTRLSGSHSRLMAAMRTAYKRWRNDHILEMKRKFGMEPLFLDHVSIAPLKMKRKKRRVRADFQMQSVFRLRPRAEDEQGE